MGVLVEAINVIVPRKTIEERYPGGLEGYIRDCPNRTLVCDEYLTRIGFMSREDVKHFIENLVDQAGLVFVENGRCEDIVVVDQFTGPTAPCDWITWGEHFDGFTFCFMEVDDSREIAVPEGWTPEQSKSLRLHTDLTRFKPIDTDGRVHVFLDRVTGKRVYMGRPVIARRPELEGGDGGHR